MEYPTFEMDGHKFVMWLPQDTKREVNMQDFMRIPFGPGIWEPVTTKLVKEILKEGDVAVDIGTSIGYFTLLFARQVGNTGKVISIEQGPMQYQYMCYNAKNNGYEDRVWTFNNAAWNENKEFQLPILGYKDKDWIVKGKKVDDILRENGIKKVDLIKIDIDGGEDFALEGLEETFKNNPKLKMIIEYYPAYIEGAGGSVKKFWEIINKYFTHEEVRGEYENASKMTSTHYNLYCQHK